MRCPAAPNKKEAVSTTGEELQVAFDVTYKPVNFLIDMGAIYSVSVTHSRPIFSEICSVVEMNRAPRFGLILSRFFTIGLCLRGNVQRANQTLKRTLRKLCQETSQPWLNLLPIDLEGS